MSSDKAPAGEGIIGGIISLFWNKKAAPSANAGANSASSDATKGQDYISWSDSVIKKCSELVGMLEDASTPSTRLISQMGELDTLLQTDHDSSALRAPNDAKVSTLLLALGFALIHLLSVSKVQQEMTASLKLLSKLLARTEFDIIHPMSSSGLYRWTPDQQKKARQYRSLLVKVHIMVATKLAEAPIVDPNGSVISVSQNLALYPRLLAILYWRLPYVGVLLRRAIAINLASCSSLMDFSCRPELPPPASTALSKGVPKRGRVKADSKAPPAMAGVLAPATTSDASSAPPTPENSPSDTSKPPTTATTHTTRSASTGAINSNPPAAVTRPHTSSMRAATPPAFIGTLPPITPLSTVTASPGTSPRPLTPTENHTTEGTTTTAPQTGIIASSPLSPPLSPPISPPIDEALAALSMDASDAARPVSPPLEDNPVIPNGNSSPPPEIIGADLHQQSGTVSPPPGEPALPTTSSPPIGDQSSTGTSSPPPGEPRLPDSSPPPASSSPAPTSSSSPPPAATTITTTTITTTSTSGTLPGASKSNPKMTRRPNANTSGFSTVPASSSSSSSSSAQPNFSFKVQLTPTSIELDDDLMEWMVLPKIGEVPFYQAFVPDAPAPAHPHTIQWNSWMRVCKRLGIISSDGSFTPTTTAPAPSSSKKKPTKPTAASQPGPSHGAQNSGAYAPATVHPHGGGSSGDRSKPGHHHSHSASTSSATQETSMIVGARSLLYNWVNFHQTLVDMGPETYLSPGCIQSPAYFVEQEPRIQWLTWFEGGQSLLFVLFFKEWINHTTLMLNRTHELYGVDWNTIPGYRQMEVALMSIYHPMVTSRIAMPLLDSSRPLVRCNPEMLSWLVKYCFNQTNAHSTESVNAMFSKVEMWFSELDRNCLRLPLSFDVDYFLAGLDIIIQIDHHVILSRLLSFIFTYAHTFRGKLRRSIIEEFFVKKHFFNLFLHWDDVVRNYYQQFLIYKTVRIRKMPHVRHGLVPPTPNALEENLMLSQQSHVMPVNRRSMYGNITTTTATSTSTNGTLTHGMPVQPLPEHSFTYGVDAEGFLVDSTDDEYLQDMRLFTITESLVRIVEDQIVPATGQPREPSGPEAQTAYPKSLEIYAPRSLSEYNFYLSRYEQKYMCAKLIPMNVIQEKRSTGAVPRSSKPKNSD